MKTIAQNRRGYIIYAILGVVAATGIIGLMVVAPNTLQVLKIFDSRKRSRTKYQIKQNLTRLLKRGLITIKYHDKEKYYELTPKGEAWLAKEKLRRQFMGSKKKWDKTWRLVMFDIKELTRRKRDLLRIELREFGFLKLQNSVWITPHDCEKVIELLKTDLMLGHDLVCVEATKISNESQLKSQFGL